jgi:PAS domain S-box-containing protein
MLLFKKTLSAMILPVADRDRTRWHRAARYGAAVVLVACITAIRSVLPLEDTPFLIFMPVMFLAGFALGRGPGILATVISAFAAEYISREQGVAILSRYSQWLGLVLYIVICIGLVVVCDLMQQVLARRRADLEALGVAKNDLEASEAFLRSVLESSPDCIKILDQNLHVVFMNEHGKRIMEVSDFDKIQSCPWPDFWQDEHNEAAKAAIASAKEGGTGHFQGFCPTQAGTPKWWDVVVTPIRTSQGNPQRLLSISRDITEEKKSEAHQQLLNHELGHRLKNTLAMVQAIANQTLRRAASVPEARMALESRLIALGTAQDVLTTTKWESAELDAIVRNALIPHGLDSGRFEIGGPVLQLSSRCALALSLALHELATNATKYGALSVEEGQVSVAWEVQEETVHFHWQERGGPPVMVPLQTGFGTVLIERSLAGYFKGTARIEYLPEGVKFDLAGPITRSRSDFTSGDAEILAI